MGDSKRVVIRNRKNGRTFEVSEQESRAIFASTTQQKYEVVEVKGATKPVKSTPPDAKKVDSGKLETKDDARKKSNKNNGKK